MSVALMPGTFSEPTLDPVDQQPDEDRTRERADEGADDPTPEAIGQKDREMPDRQAHHHPAEHAHQRLLPCLRFRGRRDFGCFG